MRTCKYTSASDQGGLFVNEKHKISVILSPAELDRFNSYCMEKGHKKSTLICRLIREHLDREAYRSPDREGSRELLVAHANGTRQGGRLRRKGS